MKPPPEPIEEPSDPRFVWFALGIGLLAFDAMLPLATGVIVDYFQLEPTSATAGGLLLTTIVSVIGIAVGGIALIICSFGESDD